MTWCCCTLSPTFPSNSLDGASLGHHSSLLHGDTPGERGEWALPFAEHLLCARLWTSCLSSPFTLITLTDRCRPSPCHGAARGARSQLLAEVPPKSPSA